MNRYAGISRECEGKFPILLIDPTNLFSHSIRRWADCHVGLFMVPLSVMGLALPWAKLHETVGTSALVWQVSYPGRAGAKTSRDGIWLWPRKSFTVVSQALVSGASVISDEGAVTAVGLYPLLLQAPLA